MLAFRFPRRISSLLLCAALAPAAQAFVVDTGPGSNFGGGATLYDDRPITTGFQQLAARFTVDAPDTITSVQGWMNWDGGRFSFALLKDFGGLPGAPMQSVTLHLPATDINVPDWRGVGGLNWTVDAGDYWLVFADTPAPGLGSMPGGAVAPLSAYASSPSLSGNGWMRADTLGVGVRINVLPEPPPAPVPLPPAWLLLLGGVAALRFAPRG